MYIKVREAVVWGSWGGSPLSAPVLGYFLWEFPPGPGFPINKVVLRTFSRGQGFNWSREHVHCP